MPNHLGKLLDLILSNTKAPQIFKSTAVAVPCDPYHPALEIFISSINEVPTIDVSHTYYNFHKANYPAILNFLESFNWTETINLLDIDSATNALYDALHYCILNFVPINKYVKPKFPIWFSPKLKSIVLAKRKAHALFKQSNDQHHYAQFSYLRAQYKFESKKCFKNYTGRLETGLNNDPKSFWKFIRNHRSENSTPNVVHLDEFSCSGPQEIANLFSKFFNSVFTNPSINKDAHLPQLCFDLPHNCSFSITDIKTALLKLKNVYSAGPDGLPGNFFFNIKSFLCTPLWQIFRRSIDEGIFPCIWKLSSITPIFKSGDKSHAKNYRPISILSHIAKLFENLVLKDILP